jgi:hypothetical protein
MCYTVSPRADKRDPMEQITLERIITWIDDVNEEYQREQDQGILQGRLDKATAALCGKDACERLKRTLALRFGMTQNIAVMLEKKRRA